MPASSMKHFLLIKKIKIKRIMKRKFKQWWSTNPPISTKQTITSHIKPLNIKMTTTYDFGNAGPGFVHAHIFYVRLLSWNWCPSSLSDSACRTSRLRIAMFYWEKKYYFDRCLPMGCRTSKESVIQKLKLFIQLCEKKQYYLHE